MPYDTIASNFLKSNMDAGVQFTLTKPLSLILNLQTIIFIWNTHKAWKLLKAYGGGAFERVEVENSAIKV